MIEEAVVTCKECVGYFNLIQGGCRGADMIAREMALKYELVHTTFPARWKKLGNRAGFARNQQMLDVGRPGLCIAFHDNLPGSGTAHMVNICKEADVPVFVFSNLEGDVIVSLRSFFNGTD